MCRLTIKACPNTINNHNHFYEELSICPSNYNAHRPTGSEEWRAYCQRSDSQSTSLESDPHGTLLGHRIGLHFTTTPQLLTPSTCRICCPTTPLPLAHLIEKSRLSQPCELAIFDAVALWKAQYRSIFAVNVLTTNEWAKLDFSSAAGFVDSFHRVRKEVYTKWELEWQSDQRRDSGERRMKYRYMREEFYGGRGGGRNGGPMAGTSWFYCDTTPIGDCGEICCAGCAGC